MMLRSLAARVSTVHVVDLVDLFVIQPNKNRGKWLSPRDVLLIDRDACLVSVSGLSVWTFYFCSSQRCSTLNSW